MECKVLADVFQLNVKPMSPEGCLDYDIENDLTDTEFTGYIDVTHKNPPLVLRIKSVDIEFIIEKYCLMDDNIILVPKQTHVLEGNSDYFSELLTCLKIPVIRISDIMSNKLNGHKSNLYMDEIALLTDYYQSIPLNTLYTYKPFTTKGIMLCNRINREITECQDRIKDIIRHTSDDINRQWIY